VAVGYSPGADQPGAADAGPPATAPPASQALPALREDLDLLPGARDPDGTPTWVLGDPVRNRYFQLDERHVRILQYWHTGDLLVLVNTLNAEHGLDVTPDEVSAMIDFLARGELLQAVDAQARDRLADAAAARRQTLFQTVLHKYLFFRFPLIRPDRLLARLYPRLGFAFRPLFWQVTALAGLYGLLLAVQNVDRLVEGFVSFMSPAGLAAFGVALVFVKILHEFGHALMCRHYGLRVPTMGVAFLVMWPVLYTDASHAWRLTSRYQRMRIALAGMVVEIGIACYALVLWFYLPDGFLRSVVFALASTTWLMSIVVNANPLMRFDGYYLLSDLLNAPNLQDRSFVMARWRLRQLLFGIDAPPPEHVRPGRLQFMIGYAWAIWIYRFFLFLGIAVLVYHFFFKALGVFLFAVEIWWFIARPIFNEVKIWRKIAPHATLPRKRMYYGFAGALLLLLLVPWKSSLHLPAVLSAGQVARVHAPASGVVEAVSVRDGERVSAGQLLLVLRSPEVEAGLRAATASLEQVALQSAGAAVDEELLRERLVVEQEAERVRSDYAALRTLEARLRIHAPVDGHVRDLDPEVHAGRWVSPATRLLTVVPGQGAEVIAWVDELSRDRVQEGYRGTFHAEASGISLAVRVASLETSAVRALDPTYHAAPNGGDIVVRQGPGGEMIPEQALYRVRLQVDAPDETLRMLAAQGRRWRGSLVLEGERRSVLLEWGTRILAALVRESGL
jgi:putative peptide zinc metalloprotease protein